MDWLTDISGIVIFAPMARMFQPVLLQSQAHMKHIEKAPEGTPQLDVSNLC